MIHLFFNLGKICLTCCNFWISSKAWNTVVDWITSRILSVISSHSFSCCQFSSFNTGLSCFDIWINSKVCNFVISWWWNNFLEPVGFQLFFQFSFCWSNAFLSFNDILFYTKIWNWIINWEIIGLNFKWCFVPWSISVSKWSIFDCLSGSIKENTENICWLFH